MCDFRDPSTFTCLYINGEEIPNPVYIRPIQFGDMAKGFKKGIYKILSSGVYFVFTDGECWWALTWDLEGKLIANR